MIYGFVYEAFTLIMLFMIRALMVIAFFTVISVSVVLYVLSTFQVVLEKIRNKQ